MTVILSQQIGSEGKRRTCSATCHKATKDKCACICGGKYHGIARGKVGPKNVEEAEAMRPIKEGVPLLEEHDEEETAEVRTAEMVDQGISDAQVFKTKDGFGVFGTEPKEAPTSGMKLASQFELDELMGKEVRTTREFSGVPKGTTGTIDEVYGDKHHRGVMVRWNLATDNPWRKEHPLRDGFGRDKKFDETVFLEVI